MPDFDGNARWHAERDVTDQTALFGLPHSGQFSADPVEWNGDRTRLTGTARLFFYRASAARPAPRSPDAVYRVSSDNAASLTLPHNIVRAYLDAYNAAPWWFTCVPDGDFTRWPLDSALAPSDERDLGIFPPTQGCAGGSFAEIRVSVDGTAAGVAPYFPRQAVDANYSFTDVLEQPAPGLQRLNITPYRVDLTPFAAILNEAGPHRINLRGRGTVEAQLLVYLDKGRARVGGAVTLNTLAGSPVRPQVQDTLAASGDTLDGRITTRQDRAFEIRGFLDTSRGRIVTTVTQTSHFLNSQAIHLEGLTYPNLRGYRQHLWLDSTVDQRSQHTRAGTVLSDEHHRVSYPLQWRYDMAGATVEWDEWVAVPRKGKLGVSQERNEDATQLRAGVHYASHLRDSFSGTHTRDLFQGLDTHWNTLVERRFWDNRGSCREAALSTVGGEVAARVSGIGCPGQANHVRWFAHPDGSPDGMGWAH